MIYNINKLFQSQKQRDWEIFFFIQFLQVIVLLVILTNYRGNESPILDFSVSRHTIIKLLKIITSQKNNIKETTASTILYYQESPPPQLLPGPKECKHYILTLKY